MTAHDHYRTLGVDRAADTATIKQAYHNLAKREHPDAGGSEGRMLQLNAAYKALSDPISRRRYDAETFPPSHPQPRAYANSAHHPDPRHRQARIIALIMLRRSLAIAVVLNVLILSAGSLPLSEGTWLALKLVGFVPVYCMVLALAFLIDPDFRLTIFDLAHSRKLRGLRSLSLILLALSLPFPPLAWAWLKLF
jgi:curved DNA-binding protein CbpA